MPWVNPRDIATVATLDRLSGRPSGRDHDRLGTPGRGAGGSEAALSSIVRGGGRSPGACLSQLPARGEGEIFHPLLYFCCPRGEVAAVHRNDCAHIASGYEDGNGRNRADPRPEHHGQSLGAREHGRRGHIAHPHRLCRPEGLPACRLVAFDSREEVEEGLAKAMLSDDPQRCCRWAHELDIALVRTTEAQGRRQRPLADSNRLTGRVQGGPGKHRPGRRTGHLDDSADLGWVRDEPVLVATTPAQQDPPAVPGVEPLTHDLGTVPSAVGKLNVHIDPGACDGAEFTASSPSPHEVRRRRRFHQEGRLCGCFSAQAVPPAGTGSSTPRLNRPTPAPTGRVALAVHNRQNNRGPGHGHCPPGTGPSRAQRGPACSWSQAMAAPAELSSGDVPIAGAQPVLRRGGMPRQPLSVRTGHDAVLATVQVQDWGTYQPRTETPGSDVGQVVVDRPPGPRSGRQR